MKFSKSVYSESEHDLRPHGRDLSLAHYKPEVLHDTDSDRVAIPDETCGLVVPLVE